jgi:hypothetical protein
LEGKNIQTKRPKAKLGAKCYGPFTIMDKLSPLTYRLDIPRQWRHIHPVFHISLLSPYVQTKEHGPSHANPPPDIINGEEEYEVKHILDGKPVGRRFKYLVKWLGYPDTENQWLAASNLDHAKDVIFDYHKQFPNAPKPQNYIHQRNVEIVP